MSNERLYIAIPVRGRLKLAEECVSTIRKAALSDDILAIYSDGSDLTNWLYRKSDVLSEEPQSIGIERQRRKHFMDLVKFSEDSPGMTHLYLTDADAPHDPNWRSELLRIQEATGGAPVCGYNTAAHANMAGNTIGEDGEVIWRRFAPGVSYLLTREHVEKVVRWLKAHPEVHHWHFDWQVPSILGHRFAITKTSYVEHIGVGGMHHPADAGYEGGDRALNPTPAVAKLRAEIVAKLQSHEP